MPPLLLLSSIVAVSLALQGSSPKVLRVCADPNNLPFSNEQRQGFENRLAELIARDLHPTMQYTWWAQRRGYLRNSPNAGRRAGDKGAATGLCPPRVPRHPYQSI